MKKSMVKGLRNAFAIRRRRHVPRAFRTRLALLTAPLGAAADRRCVILHQMVRLSLSQANARCPDGHSVSWHKNYTFGLGNSTTGAVRNSLLSTGHWDWNAIPINQDLLGCWYHSVVLPT